jgi:hypothetical protein
MHPNPDPNGAARSERTSRVGILASKPMIYEIYIFRVNCGKQKAKQKKNQYSRSSSRRLKNWTTIRNHFRMSILGSASRDLDGKKGSALTQ